MKNQASRRAAIGFVALALALSAEAQITVNEGDLPQGGTSHTFQNLPLEGLFDFESSGPGWVWDFSELVPTDSSVQEVADIDEASFTTALVFNSPWDPDHQADHFYAFLALPDLGDMGLPVDIESITGYHQIANGNYTQVGLSLTLSGFEVPITFADVDEVHPVPLTADATMESTAAYAVDIPENLHYSVDQTRESVVDGYGTLLLPDGTSHEVLRLRSTVLSDDSVYVSALGQGTAFQRETVTYSWLSDGGLPWMEVSTTFGVPTTVRYQGSAPPVAGVMAAASNATLYPNPVQRGATVRLGENVSATWAVHALSGERVRTFRGRTLSTDGLAPGMYLVRNEATGMTRRLVVQ
jgi:hypothetical protein